MSLDSEIDFEGGLIKTYLSGQDSGEKVPAVILIHEIWGLSDHIKEVARRLSGKGFLVLAPDLLEGTGVSENWTPELMAVLSDPKTKDAAQPRMREIMAPINSPEYGEKIVRKLEACFKFLKDHKNSNDKVAIVGFCFGGSYSFELACSEPELNCAISFYGHGPEDEEKIQKINCPILAFYGEQDTNLMNQLPFLKEVMKKFNKDLEVVVYPNAGHAFFNDTNSKRYNKEAAEDSWNRMLEFLDKNLKD